MFEVDSLFIVEPMRLDDVPQVMAIERESFPLPWPERAYHYELSRNVSSHYVVLRRSPEPATVSWWQSLKRLWRENSRGPILGYGGFWLIADEAHVSTIAVAPDWRKQGFGELLLWNMLKDAASKRAFEATLEVRVSNHIAQKLYLKYGFEKVGQRRRYYQDNGEDAWIMTVSDFGSEAYQAHLDQLGQRLYRRLRQPAQS